MVRRNDCQLNGHIGGCLNGIKTREHEKQDIDEPARGIKNKELVVCILQGDGHRTCAEVCEVGRPKVPLKGVCTCSSAGRKAVSTQPGGSGTDVGCG